MIEISGIGVLTAFAAGVVSFLSPCVLPLVPGYLSYVSGQSLEDMQNQQQIRARLVVTVLSLCFVLGFSTVFIAFGASASAIGRLLLAYKSEVNIVGGAIIILFGLFMTGLLRLDWLQREFRLHGDSNNSGSGRPVAAYILGLAFAFGWTPCIGPILGSILMVSASTNTVGNGITLLSIYSLGLGLPFIGAALFTNYFLHHARRVRHHAMRIQIGAGSLMIIMGIAMITGYLSDFSWWLLSVFPWLGKIG
jgi:cytochrome c-type biogenesis protein